MMARTKTMLFLLGTLLAVMISFSVYIYESLSSYSQQDFNKLLEIRAITAAKVELGKPKSERADDLEEIRSEFFEKLPTEEDYFINLDSSFQIQEKATQLKLPADFLKDIIENGKATHQSKDLYFKGILYNGEKGEHIVIASAQNYFDMHRTNYMRRTMIFTFISACVIILIFSFYLSRYIIQPLNDFIERVQQISSENLHLRLSTSTRKGELKDLAFTFNDMLDRLETSFETQNNFISNASHELRTPLTTIIGEADVSLSKPRTCQDYVESLQVILNEAEKLDKKTQALLFLAQTGFNGKIQKFDKVRIDQLLYDVKEIVERINRQNKIQLDMGLLPENPAKLKVKGNEQLLHLALSNIIGNACKYSDHKPVNVSIGASDSHVIIVVKDQGIGIPQEEIKYIYDPFFRASNTKNYEGYGIGLPLTMNIIRMHQGEMQVSSIINKGTTVELRLPIGPYGIG